MQYGSIAISNSNMQNFKKSQPPPFFLAVFFLCIFALIYSKQHPPVPISHLQETGAVKDHWRETLTPEQYHVLREAGTETPFTGALNHETRKGTYYSVGCDMPLFRSEQKFDSGTGWPSFWAPITGDALILRKEVSDDRIEVLDTCGSHLGHIFDDGPTSTGKRYCMNSVCLELEAEK